MSLQYVDEHAIAELERQLAGDALACARFMLDFAAAWESRLARLVAAIQRGDRDDTHAVLLSIVSSSRMLGVHTLAAEAEDVRRGLQHLGPAQIDLGALREAGDQTRIELTLHASRIQGTLR